MVDFTIFQAVGASAVKDKVIFELQAENARLTAEREANYIKWQEKYAKVKQDRDELKTANVECKEFIESFIKDPLEGKVYPRSAYCPMKALAKRDLEMKEKGVEELRGSTGFWNLSNCKMRTYVRSFEKYLREQREQLTKQAEGL